jgi:serine protease Do
MLREVLQTDCTISSGDSGGPLFDMHGRVIGIHSAITASLSGNYHVPISAFYESWDTLVKPETVRRVVPKPQVALGAQLVDNASGCVLSTIEPNSLAAKTGLKAGDVVLSVDGRDIKASASFRRWLEEAVPGEVLELRVKRGTKQLSLKLTLPEKGSAARS